MFKLRRALSRFPTYCRLLAEHLDKMGVSVDPVSWMGTNSQYAWLKNYVAASAKIAALARFGRRGEICAEHSAGLRSCSTSSNTSRRAGLMTRVSSSR